MSAPIGMTATRTFDRRPEELEAPTDRKVYTSVLNGAFAAFNSTRFLTYLPTMWAIAISGDSSQHSLITWLAWVGANVSMAAWLYENNGRKVNRAIVVSLVNAVMCTGTCALIAWFR